MESLGELNMSLKIKPSKKINIDVDENDSSLEFIDSNNIIGTSLGKPLGKPLTCKLSKYKRPNLKPQMPKMPGEGLKRGISYYADYGGCGWWRMIQPEILLNANQQAIINGVTTMILHESFYGGMSAVKLQRQATPHQLKFMTFLKNISKTFKLKLIYEIDDIIFVDDIPKFNRCRMAFENPEILNSSMQIMQLADEISVTCEYMKEYYKEKTGNKNITVIPNYPSRMWFDNYYDEKRLLDNFEKNKKRPRILYAGSGTHVDVLNKTNQHDDFTHVNKHIITSRKDFKWVFVGCYPMCMKQYIDNGEMEFIPWYPLLKLPLAYIETTPQCVFAPLLDCTFNKAKSNIKFLEASCIGVPGVFQDLVTYKDASLRFKTGDDLIDNLKTLCKDVSFYSEQSKLCRQYAETMFLDDHIDEHYELFFTNYGDERKFLTKFNPEQVMSKKV